jgi:hypothetical protein
MDTLPYQEQPSPTTLDHETVDNENIQDFNEHMVVADLVSYYKCHYE